MRKFADVCKAIAIKRYAQFHFDKKCKTDDTVILADIQNASHALVSYEITIKLV